MEEIWSLGAGKSEHPSLLLFWPNLLHLLLSSWQIYNNYREKIFRRYEKIYTTLLGCIQLSRTNKLYPVATLQMHFLPEGGRVGGFALTVLGRWMFFVSADFITAFPPQGSWHMSPNLAVLLPARSNVGQIRKIRFGPCGLNWNKFKDCPTVAFPDTLCYFWR